MSTWRRDPHSLAPAPPVSLDEERLPQPFRSADFIRPLFKIGLFAIAPLVLGAIKPGIGYLLGFEVFRDGIGNLIGLVIDFLAAISLLLVFPACVAVVGQTIHDRYISRAESLVLALVGFLVVSGYCSLFWLYLDYFDPYP